MFKGNSLLFRIAAQICRVIADFVDVPEKQIHQSKRANTFLQYENFRKKILTGNVCITAGSGCSWILGFD